MWVPYYLIHFYFMLQIKIVQGSVLHVIHSIATIHICACTYSHHNDKLFNFSIRNHHIYIHQNKWQMNVLMIILSGGNGPTLNSWKCQFQFYCSRYHQFRLYFCMNWNCTSKVISSSHVSVRSTISLSFSSQGNTKFAKLSCYLLRMTHTLVSDYCAYNMMSMCCFSITAYLQTPENATVCLGSVSNISCASTNAQTIFYLVNGTQVPSPTLSGFSASAPIPIGNVTLVVLTVPGVSIGVSYILCKILLANGTFVDSNSYLTVRGMYNECSCVNYWMALLCLWWKISNNLKKIINMYIVYKKEQNT